jgi:hypothetical protein
MRNEYAQRKRRGGMEGRKERGVRAAARANKCREWHDGNHIKAVSVDQ